MPVIMTFDQPVTRKAAVERAAGRSPRSRLPSVGWYWVNDQMVRWRPKAVLAARHRRHGPQPPRGRQLRQGVWGDDDDMARFSIGSLDGQHRRHRQPPMIVEQGGKVIRTLPITTGKPGWDTRTGTKVIMSKEREVVMDAATLDVDEGDPEYYRLDVEYAMRLTWSGEYVHAAPWSVRVAG